MDTSSSLRTIVGPLSTVFTPPTPCTTTDIVSSYTFIPPSIYPFGKACYLSGADIYLTDVASCYPPGFASAIADQNAFAAFSPAMSCPSGWEGIGGATKDAQGQVSGYAVDWEPYMRAGESLVICCPSGYSSPIYEGIGTPLPMCYTTIRANLLVTGVSYELINGECTPTETSVSYSQMYAVSQTAINLLFQPTDAAALSMSGSSSSSESAGNATEASGNEGLSTGAKVAIGVVVPVAVLVLVALAAWFFVRRWRSRRAANATTAGSTRQYIEPKAELDGNGVQQQHTQFAPKPAEEGYYIAGDQQAWKPVEMGSPYESGPVGQTMQPAELPDSRPR